MSQAFDQYIDNLKKKEKSAAGTSAALSASQQNVPYYQTRSEANNLYNQAKTLKDSLFTIQDNDLFNAYQKAGVLGRYSDTLMGRYAIDPAGIAYQSPLFRGQGTVKQTEELMGIVRPLGGNNINQRLTAPQIRMNAVSNRLSGDMDYDTYKKLMDSQIGVGDADTQRLLMTYGGGTVEKGTARMAAAAAASATSMEALEDMLAKARTDTERAAINAEISKRQSRRIDKSGIGQYGLGNIDLYNRKPYTNDDGSISTVDSFSVNIDGKEVLLPSIIDGRRVTDEEAIAHYMKTGEHLGKFNTPEEADDYAKRLHIQQEDLYTDPEDAYRNGLYRAMPPEMQAYVDEYDQSDMPLTNDEMRDMLRGERDKLQASYRADMTAEEKRMLRLRTEEMDRALNDIETEKAGPIYQTPEMQAFSTWQEQGKDTSYLTRYQQDAAQEAQDWTDVTRGRYYGEDKEKQESSDKIEQLTDEYNALVSTVGGITDPQEYATTMQRMEEIETELDALNTVAEQKAGSEGEKLDAIKTAQHGEADLGRYAKALGNEALKMWQNALGGISAGATRAGEMLYGIGKNLVTEGGEGLGDTIVDIYQNGAGAKMERYYKKQLDDAVEESYHARKAISDSPVLDVAHSILVNGLEMIPDIAMTLMTNGANKAADATVMLQNAMMNYMSSLGQGQVQRLMANMSTNPSFYTSFVREWASDIQDLKEKKVPVGLAEVLGTFTAGINAMLEVGSGGDSGIQMIGKDADDGIITRGYKALTGNDAGKAIQAVDRGFQMGLGEGTEEITQGIESAAFQGMGKALATGEGTKAVSLTPGEEALINVPDLAYEGMVGALSGVAMGGATDTVNRAAETKAQNREIGEQIINNNWGEALGGIAEDAAGISNDTTKALREGTADLSSKKVKQKVGQLYQQMMDKLDKASTNRIQIQMERSIENAMIRNDFPATSREQLKAAAKAVAKAYGLGPQSLNETELEIMQRPEVQEVYEGLTGENAEFQDQFGPATLRKGREAQQAMNQARVMLMTRNMPQEEVIQRTKENLNENVAEEDRDALAAAIVKQENGQELSEAESKALDKYGLNMDAMGDEYGTETAYNYGRSGRSQEELARNLRSAGIDVTDEVRQQYQQGEKERIQAEQNRIQQIRELNQGGKNGQRNGVVRGASEREAQYYNVKQIDAGKLTTKQKAAIEALRTVAGKMNLNIALFESQTNEKGTHVGANGFYDESTDTVYLDIFAGYEKNEQAILRTAAHELTHVIQQWSPQEYANLRDFLLESYYGQGENTVAQLIQHQMDVARRSGRNMTEPQAMDELVADACEMMLGDAEGAARMAQKNPSLFEKIKNWISDFVQAIKAAMEGVDPQTREARLLAGMQERFEKARDLWYAGFNQAAENRGGGMDAEMAPETITSQENLSAAPAENAGAAVAQPAAEAPRRAENGQKRVTITKHEVNANRGIAYTNDQTPVSFHYEVVPVDSLITSNNQRFEANPDYPQELQPRDRTRTASREQVYGIARNLNPARLGQSADVQNGAPIVGSDLVVESGNGRTMALRYAMQNMPGQAQQYTAWLRQNAARFGLDPDSIQEDSVLVRVRDSAMDRTAFVKAANESTTAAYSESEAAESDAEKLTPAMMQIFEPGENGELNAAGNSAFANRYMEQVIPAAERGNYMQADGTISQRGWERIQNGIFQKAYGSAALTQMLSESTDEGSRNILKAMLRAAPRAVQTAEQIRQGNTWDIGLGDMLTNAAKRYLQLKRDGIKLDTYLNQTTMPGLETEDAGTQALMRAFEDLNRAPRRLGNVLQNVMDLLVEYGDPRQVNMLGESTAPDAAALISQAVARENQNNADGIKQSARDSEYMQAVESGDTEEQQRLVDEAAENALSDSIVRNSDGSLKKVYHGTGAMFNQFSYDFMSAHGSMEGQGFYFTDNPEMANMYKGPNGRVLEGYLDMRKTLSDSKKTMTRAQLRTLLQKIDPTGDDILINYERSGGVGYPGAAWKARALNDTVDTIYSGSDSDSEMLAEIANSGAGTELTVKMAREMGFDGYIVKDKYTSGKHSGEVYVAFESSQFKQSDPVTYDDQGDVIPLSERFNPGNNDIRYSYRAANGIEEGMTDDERYDKLKDMRIELADATNNLTEEELKPFKTVSYRVARRPLANLARQYGLIRGDGNKAKVLTNKYLTDVPATFSKASLDESIENQKTGIANMAALMPVFEETYKNAVPVLLQGNRYLYTAQEESDTNAFMYLLGGFNYNGKTIPVQFELKKNNNPDDNSVYVVATIKKDAIMALEPAIATPRTPASSTISIKDLIGNVNGNETKILANLPSQFLTDYQKEGKRKGLEEKGRHIRNKAAGAGRDINAPVNMTTERIDRDIKYYGSSGDYSKAYMTYISPEDYISLTTSNQERIENESRVMVAAEMRENEQTPFLRFDQDTGEITGHEGRHRIMAMKNAGVQRVAILMIPDGEKGRSNRQTIESLVVTGQDFGSTRAWGSTTLNNLIPVNQKHRQELIDTYGESKNWFKYSARDTETEPAEGKPETTIDGMVETKKMPGGTITRQYSYRSWTADEQQTVLRNLINNGFDRKRAEQWIADVNSIAAIIGSDRARLDYDADPNGTFVKPNNEYRVTVDASTLCAKRLLYQGTFNEISRRIPNSPLRPGDLIQLVNMMKDAGHVTPCSICYVESRRRNLGNYAEKFLQEYEGENKPTLAQLTTTDGLANLKNNNPDAYEAFIRAMNKKGTSNPKVVQLRTDYRGDLRNLKPADIRYINHIGGLRFQSFSDFEAVHMIDLMQAVMDGAASHLIAQAYTKVPDFAWVFGPTGIKINLSLIGEGNGLDADGKLIFSDSEGIDHKEAFEIRKTYGKNVGTILVGMNDAHILAAMADDRIDFIIPFHRSGWSKADRARMRNLGEYFDYTMFQNERYFIRNADGSFQKTKNGQYKTVRIPEGNLYPSDYWEYDKSGKENAEIYLKLCAKQGRVPKFARFLVDNKDGSFSLQPDGSTDGYWKLLIDYKMYDNEGNPAPQMAMQPNFNMDKAKEVLAKYEGGANHLPVAEDIVEPFIDWYKQAHPKAKYSQRDTSYEENDNYNTIRSADEGLEADMRGSDGTETHYGNHVKFSMRVTEPRELDFLENQTTIKTYKTMQLIDGHLYPPMAAVVAGSKEDYSVLGQWEKATEHPELIKDGNKFTLNKGRGQGSLAAAYNPYMHSSNLMINDQFSGAYARPNLVTVECEVPSSEATSNYHAEYAKDNTGWHSWHTGVVAGALRHAKGTERKVFLSRWIKPVRIVPDTEVAQHYADLLSGTDVEIPDNVVYPSLLEELKKLNIPIKESGRLNNNIKRSDRDTAYQTNRQILAGALTTIAANESERQMLEQYQNVAGQLDMNERRISQINEELRNLRLEEPGSDRERALLAERKQLEQEITAADKRLYTMERLAPMRRIASQQRAKAENDLQRAREHMQRYREGIVQRERIASIERTSRRLAKWLTAPAGKSGNYVPEALRGPLGEFLLTIDKMSKQRREGGPMTQEDKKFAYQLGQISRMLQSIDDGQTGTTEEQISGMYLDMPKQFTQNLTELVNRVEQRMQQAGARPGGNMLDQMSNEELETLDQSMIAISSSITHINDFMSDSFTKGVRETAAETIRDLDAMKPQGKQGKVRKFLTDFITWDNSMPIFAFERLGKTGRAVFDSMREGQGKLAFNAAKIKEESEKIYTAKEGNDWSREIKEFDFGDGNKIRIPVANLMSLYCLNQREQGIGHLYGEGIRVADFEEGKGARKATVHDKGHVVSEAQVQKMLEALTPRQIEVARKLQHLMSTLGAEWGNYVSMRRFGFRQFTEQNYFPIKSDSDLLPARTDNGTGNELYKLLNMSAAKPLVQKANNRLMLENIFEVFGGHMADMAQYNALALPVLDAVKWFNFKESVQEEGESAKYTSGVRDSIRNAYGQSAIKYVTEFLKDINGGGMTGDTNTDLMKKMLGKYNRVAVAANLRVALLQPLAIIRAGVELPGTSLASGTIKAIPNLKKEVAEMQAHSGIALWKDLGYREMNIGRSLKQQIMHMDTLTDKISDKSMALAGLMDNVTWGAMWKASKEYINRTQPTLTRGSEEYFKAVTKKFEDVVYKTQVVDSMLTKSQLMRSQNNFNKLISSFMSEPTTTFNQLMAVWDKFRVAMKNGSNFSQAFQKHGKALGRTAFYYLLAAAVNTAIEQLMTAYRDDDDYENFQEKYMDGFWETMIDNANPLTLLPGMKQIWEAGGKRLLGMDTFDSQNVLTEGINTVVDGIEKIAQGKGTVWGRAYTLAKGLSMTSGLPLHPLMREFQAIWNATAAQIQPDWRLETSPTSKTIGYDILYKALQEKDEERVKYILDRLSVNGASDDAITTNLTNRIKADYASGQISAAEAESRLVDMVGKKANDAYFNVQQWKDKVEDDGEYSRFDKLEAAILSNGSTAEAEKELLDHGYTQKQVDAKKKTLITDAAKDGKITDAQATQMFAKYTDLDKDDAYWRLQGAHYEKQDDDDSYQKYGKLEDAILTGKGYEAAKAELTSHGVKEADVASKVRSIVTEQVVKQGMTDAKAMDLLIKYGGMDDNEAWIRTQELAYQKATGNSTSSDIAMVNLAIEKHASPKAAIDGLLAHGKEKSSIASSITSKYKQQYLDLVKTNVSQAATLKGQLISIFEYLGYDGKKKISDWENPKKKTK